MAAPSTPATPVVTPGNGQLTVTWTPPADGGSPITFYTLRHRVAPSGTYTQFNVGTVLTWVITGLTNGTAYQVSIRASNADGASGFSPAGTGTPAGAAIPHGAVLLRHGHRAVVVGHRSAAGKIALGHGHRGTVVGRRTHAVVQIAAPRFDIAVAGQLSETAAYMKTVPAPLPMPIVPAEPSELMLRPELRAFTVDR